MDRIISIVHTFLILNGTTAHLLWQFIIFMYGKNRESCSGHAGRLSEVSTRSYYDKPYDRVCLSLVRFFTRVVVIVVHLNVSVAGATPLSDFYRSVAREISRSRIFSFFFSHHWNSHAFVKIIGTRWPRMISSEIRLSSL